jgi:peptidoglycan hydrolase CwlO-like protein
MKLYVIIFILFTNLAHADGSNEDFKNDNFQGKNKRQRIDSNASQISSMLKDIAFLKAEVETLKSRISSLSSQQGSSEEKFQLRPPGDQ